MLLRFRYSRTKKKQKQKHDRAMRDPFERLFGAR